LFTKRGLRSHEVVSGLVASFRGKATSHLEKETIVESHFRFALGSRMEKLLFRSQKLKLKDSYRIFRPIGSADGQDASVASLRVTCRLDGLTEPHKSTIGPETRELGAQKHSLATGCTEVRTDAATFSGTIQRT
jgi:hypothetical protein